MLPLNLTNELDTLFKYYTCKDIIVRDTKFLVCNYTASTQQEMHDHQKYFHQNDSIIYPNSLRDSLCCH